MSEWGGLYLWKPIVCRGSVRRIIGQTDTLPLRVEKLFQDKPSASFAVASVLTLLALVTIVLKAILESKTHSPSGDGPLQEVALRE